MDMFMAQWKARLLLNLESGIGQLRPNGLEAADRSPIARAWSLAKVRVRVLCAGQGQRPTHTGAPVELWTPHSEPECTGLGVRRIGLPTSSRH